MEVQFADREVQADEELERLKRLLAQSELEKDQAISEVAKLARQAGELEQSLDKITQDKETAEAELKAMYAELEGL